MVKVRGARVPPAAIIVSAVMGLVAAGAAAASVGEFGYAAIPVVLVPGLLLAGRLAASLAGDSEAWPTLLTAGLVTGLAAAVPVYLVVDLWHNFCIFECGAHESGPALLWSLGVLAASLAAHALMAVAVRGTAEAPQDPSEA